MSERDKQQEQERKADARIEKTKRVTGQDAVVREKKRERREKVVCEV